MNSTKQTRLVFWRVAALTAMVYSASLALLGQEGPWKLIFPPSDRTDGGMVYDAGQKRMILFGGIAYGRAHQDTWIFQNGVWKRFSAGPSAPVPSARGRFASCFHAARGEMMVFGGAAYGILCGDLWLFKNGWVKASATAGPSAREGAAMAYDSESKAVILFGGRSAAGFENDTWKYENGAWTKLTIAAAPPARWKHALVYDSVRREFILYGGLAAADLSDTWALKGNVWTKIAGPNPGARNTPSMTFDSARQRVVLFGGLKGTALLGATWQFKAGKWSKIASGGPSARAGAAMAYDSEQDRVFLFGGWRGTALILSDTWAFKNNGWVQISQSVPDARARHGLTYDASRKKLVLFGGEADSSRVSLKLFNDTWERDENGWTKIAVSGPSARRSPSMAYDEAVKVVVLHGGWDSQWQALKDTWTYNGQRWTQAALNGPATSGAMAYYPKLGAVILVSRDCSTFKWQWQSQTWTQILTTVSPESGEIFGTAMAYDARRGVLVLFGGEGTEYSRMWPPLFDTVWEFDGTTWSAKAKPTASAAGNWPWARCYHVLFYDALRQCVILTEGIRICRDPNNYNEYYNYRWVYLNDTWSWDGANWTLLTQGGRSLCASAGVYDVSGSAWAVFGGEDPGAALNLDQIEGFRHYNSLFVLKPPLPAAGKFDFEVSSLSLPKLIWESGDKVKATVRIKNGGSVASSPTLVWLYASLDDAITDDDLFLSKATVPAIAPGGAFETTMSISVNALQAAIPESFYYYNDEVYLYIGAYVDRFEQFRDAKLGDNILFLKDTVTLKKPASSAARRPIGRSLKTRTSPPPRR
jgi:hypothetical protein